MNAAVPRPETRTQRLLRAAQGRSGVSQREWARRSRIAQPLISRYLSGESQPSTGQLDRLLDALDLELDIELVGRDPSRPSTRELGQTLVEVLYLADALPHTKRGPMTQPPFLQLIRHG